MTFSYLFEYDRNFCFISSCVEAGGEEEEEEAEYSCGEFHLTGTCSESVRSGLTFHYKYLSPPNNMLQIPLSDQILEYLNSQYSMNIRVNGKQI